MQPQVPVQGPDPTRPGTAAQYGEPVRQPLAGIAENPEAYRSHHPHVITQGRLDVLASQTWGLSDGGAPVLLLLGHGMESQMLNKFTGGRIEVRGIVRALRPKVYVRGVDLDLIEDPDLPVLPAPAFDLPKVSITMLSFTDAEAQGAAAKTSSEVTPADILADPQQYRGKSVRFVGRFRGRNLYSDLPDASRRNPDDWVLHDGGRAMWVCGKAPRGKGWSLDPASKGDTSRWLEVTGKAEVVSGIVYVRASKVALTKAPARDAPP
jgi:hypothetical protein